MKAAKAILADAAMPPPPPAPPAPPVVPGGQQPAPGQPPHPTVPGAPVPDQHTEHPDWNMASKIAKRSRDMNSSS
jgi:hypothetical protein